MFELTAKDYFEGANKLAAKAMRHRRRGPQSAALVGHYRREAAEARAKGRELARQDQQQP